MATPLTKEEKEGLEAHIKEGKGLYTGDQMARARVYEDYVLSKDKSDECKNYIAVLEGDYSKYEKLNPILQGMLATDMKPNNVITRDVINEINNPDISAEEKAQSLYDNKLNLNPVIRTHLSLRGKEPTPDGDMCKAVGEHLNLAAVKATLKNPTFAQRAAVLADYKGDVKKTDDAMKRDREQRKVVAKILFMAQVGDFTITDEKNGDSSQRRAYPQGTPISEILSHGGRTAFILPKGAGDTVLDSLTLPSRHGKPEVISWRKSGSSHRMSQPDDNLELTGLKEHKYGFPDPRGLSANTYGMSVAVGGIGNTCVPGTNVRPILNDDKCGHLLIHNNTGNDSKKGVLFVGMETAGPLETNRNGKTHKDATASKMSSTGGLKTDRIGNEYGGRVVDLSNITANQIADINTAVEVVFEHGTDNEIEQFIEVVSGPKATPQQLANCLYQRPSNSQRVKDGREDMLNVLQRGQMTVNDRKAELNAQAQTAATGQANRQQQGLGQASSTATGNVSPAPANTGVNSRIPVGSASPNPVPGLPVRHTGSANASSTPTQRTNPFARPAQTPSVPVHPQQQAQTPPPVPVHPQQQTQGRQVQAQTTPAVSPPPVPTHPQQQAQGRQVQAQTSPAASPPPVPTHPQQQAQGRQAQAQTSPAVSPPPVPLHPQQQAQGRQVQAQTTPAAPPPPVPVHPQQQAQGRQAPTAVSPRNPSTPSGASATPPGSTGQTSQPVRGSNYGPPKRAPSNIPPPTGPLESAGASTTPAQGQTRRSVGANTNNSPFSAASQSSQQQSVSLQSFRRADSTKISAGTGRINNTKPTPAPSSGF